MSNEEEEEDEDDKGRIKAAEEFEEKPAISAALVKDRLLLRKGQSVDYDERDVVDDNDKTTRERDFFVTSCAQWYILKL